MAFRSNLEKRVSRILNNEFEYESARFKYTVDHEYLADFSRMDGLVIEVKGRFRTSDEARKYLEIREQHPDIKLVFVFSNNSTPMPNAKRRKDGTRFTMQEWANKHGFDWYTPETIPESWT